MAQWQGLLVRRKKRGGGREGKGEGEWRKRRRRKEGVEEDEEMVKRDVGVTRGEVERRADIERMKKSMKERRDGGARAQVGGREGGREGKRLTLLNEQTKHRRGESEERDGRIETLE